MTHVDPLKIGMYVQQFQEAGRLDDIPKKLQNKLLRAQQKWTSIELSEDEAAVLVGLT